MGCRIAAWHRLRSPRRVCKRYTEGEELKPERSRSARRIIAVLTYISQDRPELSLATRVLTQQMSKLTDRTKVGIKKVIRHLQKYPKATMWFSDEREGGIIRVWTDKGWAGESASRRSSRGGWLSLECVVGASLNAASPCRPEGGAQRSGDGDVRRNRGSEVVQGGNVLMLMHVRECFCARGRSCEAFGH